MKRNENGVFTFFSYQACLSACKWTGSIGRFMPQHKKKKPASQDNSFPLWEIYDSISVSISCRTASSAHLGHVSHSPLWQMSSAQRVSGLHCCTSSSARSTSALRSRTLRLNGIHGAWRNGASLLWVTKYSLRFRNQHVPYQPELTLHMQSTLQRSCEPKGGRVA